MGGQSLDRRLEPCQGPRQEVYRYPLAHGAVVAFLLGASLVGGYVEMVFFFADMRNNSCMPMIDSISMASLPHALLLAWQCKFRGYSISKSLAAVLTYQGSEMFVRCQAPEEKVGSMAELHLELDLIPSSSALISE